MLPRIGSKAAEEQVETATGALVSAAHWPAAADAVDGKSLSASDSALGGQRWGRGELMQTIRVPYWQLQSDADEVYRRELSIP